MTLVSSVQGGLVTLGDVILHGNNPKKYWKCMPVRLSIRDTMCFAPTGQKALSCLGDAIDVPKQKLIGEDEPYDNRYSKNDMLSYLQNEPEAFCEYAASDPLITLLYPSELFGYNLRCPVTVTAAATKVAKADCICQHYMCYFCCTPASG